MALSGNLVIEQFGVGAADVEFPTFDPDGQPTGRVELRKVVVIQSGDVRIELRIPPSDYDAFLTTLRGARVDVVPAGALAALKLPGRNGGH